MPSLLAGLAGLFVFMAIACQRCPESTGRGYPGYTVMRLPGERYSGYRIEGSKLLPLRRRGQSPEGRRAANLSYVTGTCFATDAIPARLRAEKIQSHARAENATKHTRKPVASDHATSPVQLSDSGGFQTWF